jgi:trk system potassium uptake protein TrkA
MKKRMVFVIGLGRFGFSICEKLVALEQQVVAVDKVRARIESVADLVHYSVQLDATDEDSLVKAGAREADVAVVAIGGNLEASILATTIIKELGVPLVISRAQTALHARVLARAGADRVVFPEKDMGKRVAEQFVFPGLAQFSQVPGTQLFVGRIKPLVDMVGKSLMELDFHSRYHSVVLLVDRQGDEFLPAADTIVLETDRLLVAGRQEALRTWIEDPGSQNKNLRGKAM